MAIDAEIILFLWCSQVILFSHRKDHCFHRSWYLPWHGTVVMEAPDQSSMPLSEINQHLWRHFLIEHSRRATQNVTNFISSKTECDPSQQHHTYWISYTPRDWGMLIIQHNVSQKVLQKLIKKFSGLIFACLDEWMLKRWRSFYIFCCCSQVAEIGRGGVCHSWL